MSANVKCPTCRTTVEWLPENVFRPFCSERCRLLDLGAWADESYKIESLPQQESEDWAAD
ncbi:MAG: DNA gyrase inhibitor YacG [Neisseria sp.]|nr:DNA gyrase inhibitor YacG [Neisseria sp.]